MRDNINNEYIYYAAYGSNLNIKDMKKRCPGARVYGTSNLKGYRLTAAGRPSETESYFTLTKEEGENTLLGIWKIPVYEEKALDFYEDFPSLYQKKKVSLKVKTQSVEEERCCTIYIMNSGMENRIPSDEYIDTCKKGYQDFGFNLLAYDKIIERIVREEVKTNDI